MGFVAVATQPVALPLASIPAATCPAEQLVGRAARDVAVAAVPDVLEVMEAGRSEATMERGLRFPLAPEGEAKNWLAAWLPRIAEMVVP
jgi:hypothetical protein